MKFIRTKEAFFLLHLSLLFFSCRNQKNDSTQPAFNSLLILMMKDYIPSDIELLKVYRIESSKRTSRSKNLWLVKLQIEDNQLNRLIEKLTELEEIESVNKSKSNLGNKTNLTIKNKKKSKPSKN
ncbi:MAG: hypothetical protein AAF600_13805 [Bacteroidota bacterium]